MGYGEGNQSRFTFSSNPRAFADVTIRGPLALVSPCLLLLLLLGDSPKQKQRVPDFHECHGDIWEEKRIYIEGPSGFSCSTFSKVPCPSSTVRRCLEKEEKST